MTGEPQSGNTLPMEAETFRPHFINQGEEDVAITEDQPADNTTAKWRTWTIAQEDVMAAVEHTAAYNHNPHR